MRFQGGRSVYNSFTTWIHGKGESGKLTPHRGKIYNNCGGVYNGVVTFCHRLPYSP